MAKRLFSSKSFTSVEEALIFMNKAKKEIAENDNAYYDSNGNVLFRLSTKFRWGRHKGNQLRDVYKVEPSYIDWCIKTCSGFAIFEDDIQKLKISSVFDIDELNKMCEPLGNNIFSIDFSSFQRDINGFLKGNTITEHHYQFRPEILDLNKNKIEKGLSFDNYQVGVPDNNNLQLKNILLNKSAIKINLIVID